MDKRSSSSLDSGATYLIGLACRIEPALVERWLPEIETVALTAESTLLSGRFPDQSALYGALSVMRDLGLPLVLVQRIDGAPSIDADQT